LRRRGVFAVAIASSVFSANAHAGSAASICDGFRPAIAVSAALALLGALNALALEGRAETARQLDTIAANAAA
jgi:hypothetical protein